MSNLTDEAANEILQNTEWCKFSDAREMIQDVYAMGHAHAAAVSAAKDARIKVLEDALNQIASWGDGPVVGPHFDEPRAAKIARAALGDKT